MILWKNQKKTHQGLKKGSLAKKYEKVWKLQRPFSRGGPNRRNQTMTDEPGEKETLNIMLREKIEFGERAFMKADHF